MTIDTLRADHVGAYGYFRETTPNIDRFAAGAIVFENAVTPMATTLPAHASIMTSTYPRRNGVFSNKLRLETSDELRTLAEMLAARGWTTAGFISAGPLGRRTGINAGFGYYDGKEKGRRSAAETTDAVIEWLRRAPTDGPFFLWVHYFDPHDPYSPPQEFRRFGADDRLRDHLSSIGSEVTERATEVNNLYDGEILFTDHHVERLFSELKELGLFDRATIVLTSDHGEGLYQHDWLKHGRIHNEQLFVPLILKPGPVTDWRPSRISRVVSTVDIVPTLVRLLGIETSKLRSRQFEGLDLLRPQRERPRVFAERVHRDRGWGPDDRFALVGLDWKYLAMSSGAEELYDMARDRSETRNLIAERPRVRERLRARLEGILGSFRPRRPNAEVDDEQKAELRALGYLD